VTEALKISALECPDCHASFSEPAQYMDHRIGEKFAEAVAEAKTQVPKPEDLLTECKDGICKMVEEHVEATYNVTKKGEEAPPPEEEEEPGLFSVEDDPEEEE